MVYAIPSYKRPDVQITLDYLNSIGVDKGRIFLFVDKSEVEAYSKNHKDKCNIVERKGDSISTVRNFILDYLVDKDRVVMMDDDISKISYGAKGIDFTDVTSSKNLFAILEKMYETTAKLRGYMFGMYPVYNNFFMKNDISTKVTVNTILGFPKGFSLRCRPEYIAKEDIELCGRILSKGGNVIRFNNISFDAKHRTNKGGANEVWNSDANVRFSKDLCIRYPRLFALQKNKPQEVRLLCKDIKQKGIEWGNISPSD